MESKEIGVKLSHISGNCCIREREETQKLVYRYVYIVKLYKSVISL